MILYMFQNSLKKLNLSQKKRASCEALYIILIYLLFTNNNIKFS